MDERARKIFEWVNKNFKYKTYSDSKYDGDEWIKKQKQRLMNCSDCRWEDD